MECPELTIVIDGYGDCVARSLFQGGGGGGEIDKEAIQSTSEINCKWILNTANARFVNRHLNCG